MSDVTELVGKLRDQLNARGAKTIRGLSRAFKIVDDSGNRKIDAQEFFYGLQDMGCQFSKDETDALMAHFDTNKDGNINFDEFLVGLRGSLNEARQAVVDAAYSKFDADGSGKITASDLRGVYNCTAHPKVISGEMTEDEVFLEFLACFGDKNNDGCITKAEWDDYYAAVSSNIDNDDHFVELICNAWKL